MINPVKETHQKIDAFIKKYYRNALIKGAILWLLSVLALYLLLIFSEFLGHFSITVRTILFFSLFSFSFILLYIWLIRPLLSLLKIRKSIGNEQVNLILSQHFPELKDQLKNILELETMLENDRLNDLIAASIEQKSKKINILPFNQAINFKENLKFLKWLSIPTIIFLSLYFYAPQVIKESTERIINYDTYYEKQAPFSILIANDSLKVKRGDNFKLSITLDGIYYPQLMFLETGGSKHLMKKETANSFSFEFKSVYQDIRFSFLSDDFQSKSYYLKVLPDPKMLHFSLQIIPPKYTGETTQELKNKGDFTAPEGSRLIWKYRISQADKVCLYTSEDTLLYQNHPKENIEYEMTANHSFSYSLGLSNQYFNKPSIFDYQAQIVKDEYPQIYLSAVADSITSSLFYFKGNAVDDYGLKQLLFCYKINNKVEKIPLTIESKELPYEFYYSFDFSKLSKSGEKLTYYFEVWDNDAVNGSKKAVSEIGQFYIPSEEEIKKIDNQHLSDIKDKLAQSRKISQEIKKEVQNLKKDLIQNQSNRFKLNNKVKNIGKKHQELQQLMKQVAEENKKNNELLNHLKQKDEILKKQQEIEKMLNNLLDEDMKKMLDEINRLMKEFNKDEFNKLSEEMEMSMEELSENLDQNLEQLKRFEVEKKIEQSISELQKLAKEHQELAKKTEQQKRKDDASEIQQQQKEHLERFKDISEKMKEIAQKNQQLKEPLKWDELEKEQEKIKEQLQNESSDLNKKKYSKSSKQQKQSAQEMEQMANQMQAMLDENQDEQYEEDLQALRQLLENLTTLSFEQEELIFNFRNLHSQSPLYVNYANQQVKWHENYELVKDSLNALASRQASVAPPIQKEIKQINRQIKQIEGDLEEHRKSHLGQAQQMIMTSVNQLSLFLAEALEQMQKEGKPSQCKKQGNCSKKGKCSKPGGKPGFKPSKKQARSLRQQMQKMLDELKKGQGKKKGKGKNGKNGKMSPEAQKRMNANRGKMIAEHEKMQKMLNDLMNGDGISPSAQKKLKDAKRLSESVKDDLISNRLSLETYKRQEMIMTRLLEAEKSEFERGQEEQRESKEGIDKKIERSKKVFKKESDKKDLKEMLSKQKFKLIPYYKNKYLEFMIHIAKQKPLTTNSNE